MALATLSLAAAVGCRSHDPAAELQLRDLTTYWIVDSPQQGQNYIAPVVRFRLTNMSKQPLSLGPGARALPRPRPGGRVGLDPGAGEHVRAARSRRVKASS